MTRAALYLRISQDRTGEHLGVDRQQQDCIEVAERAGWEIAETYVDNDTSAYKARPEFDRMLKDIGEGHIDAIVAWAPDRIYRRMRQLEDIIDFIETHGTQIRTVKAGDFDLSTAYGRMLARVLGSVAAGEGEIKAERWKRSWRQGREAGTWAAGRTRTFGYTKDGRVIEEEAKWAREMAQKIAAGDSIVSVARWLQDNGVVGTRGSAWTNASIKAYLTSPRVAAWSSLNGDIICEGDWQPIIDRETWENVRAMLTARTRPYIAKVSSLTRLIECGACGTQMITSGYTRNGESRRTYRCVNRPGIDGCGKVSGNAVYIEEVVYAYARGRLADERVRKRIGELRAEPTGAQAEIAALELRRAELEAELDEPGTPVATIMRAIARTKERQADLLDDLAARNLEPLPADDEWPDDIRRRRALVDLVVKRIVLLKATKPSRHGFDPERVVIEER